VPSGEKNVYTQTMDMLCNEAAHNITFARWLYPRFPKYQTLRRDIHGLLASMIECSGPKRTPRKMADLLIRHGVSKIERDGHDLFA